MSDRKGKASFSYFSICLVVKLLFWTLAFYTHLHRHVHLSHALPLSSILSRVIMLSFAFWFCISLCGSSSHSVMFGKEAGSDIFGKRLCREAFWARQAENRAWCVCFQPSEEERSLLFISELMLLYESLFLLSALLLFKLSVENTLQHFQ